MLARVREDSSVSNRMEGSKAYGGGHLAFSNHSDSLFVKVVMAHGHQNSTTLRFGVCVHACNTQWQENNACEKLSIEEALNRIAELLPSVDDFVCILKLCRKSKKLACTEQVHIHMCDNGLQDHAALGNYLIPVFVECGCMPKALQVFNRLVEHNEHSWTSLIQESIECGQLQHALNLYQQMKEELVPPSRYTLVALLKACGGLKCLEIGHEFHSQAIKYGLSSEDLYLRSTLVDMYGKCGSLMEAQELFDKQPAQDIVSWTALIAGYVEHGFGEEALNCFEQMQSEGVSPNAVTFVCSLKACVIPGAIDRGQDIHLEIVKEGYERDLFVGSSLVDMYAKCGSLVEAQDVFDELPVQDVVSWTALIAGYVEYGFGEEALQCLEQMQKDSVSQNAVTFMFGLKACGIIGAIDRGQKIHSDVAKAGLERDLLVANTLVDTYAKCGLLAEAWTVFNKLPFQDVVTWNALISGYSEQGLGEEALNCFRKMQVEGIPWDVVTFVYSLKACGSIGATDGGREIHLEIVKEGFDTNVCVGSTVVDMYAKCGLLAEAWEVFIQLPVRDVVSWTTIIIGYVEQELNEEALNCMEQMQLEDVAPNAFTYVSSLKACAGIGAVGKGQEFHAEIVKLGFERDPFVGNTLVDMHAEMGSLVEAEAVFDKLLFPDLVSWNVLMAGYAEYGLGEEVWDCFQVMQQEGVTLNAVTSILTLKACNSIGAIDRGLQIHAKIVQESLERHPFVSSSLVDMYSKCGFLAEAWDVFTELPVQDVVSWTALIAGLSEDGFGEEALSCFEQMQLAGVPPNPMTFVCILKACGNLRALDMGQGIHVDIVKEEFEDDIFLGSSLIDMYAKCGLLADAKDVFDELPIQDVVSWTALMAGYTKHGLAKEALACLEQMKLGGVCPNVVTFVCSLKACGTIEAIDSGRQIHSEVAIQGFETDPFIVNVLGNMYASCGSLVEAMEVFKELPVRDVVSWTALIVGYTKQGCGEEALDLLEQMRLHGASLNADAWASILKAFGCSGTADKCRELHIIIVKDGFERDTFVSSTLVDMYIKCGLFAEAQDLLNKLPSQRAVSWMALIAGSLECGVGEKQGNVWNRCKARVHS